MSGTPTAPAPTGPIWPVRLATHVWHPNGPTGQALLLHGLGSDGTTMWRLASHLADRGYLVAAPDLRSHGRSPVASDHRIEALTEDIAALGSSWDLVVGHSLGGAVAAHLLTRQDVEVACALLIDPVLELEPAAREPVRAVQRAEVGRLEATAVAAANPRWSPMDVDRKVLAAASCTPDVVDRVIDHNPSWDLADIAAAWRARVHLLAADPSLGALLAPDTAARLVDGERITSTTVAGAGHSVHRDDPASVLAAIDALLGAT
ncbi:alpha/beta fold hydrolase [Nitriliruptor alkaliphilus]|uniref:alpha/beta fold hydrolase n=1 Tax=Nitriliruptor alkaliphilus TaxID=427918 RepID=UPI0006968260|nr:alpha/beta hydrolase [Nitriliruptor alkaliphilus]